MSRVLWAHGPKPEYALDSDWADQYYIPARVIPCIGKNDTVILPGGSTEVREFWEFCCRVLGLQDEQAMWTSGSNYLLDQDIAKELVPELSARIGDEIFTIYPYAATEESEKWTSKFLHATVFGDKPSFGDRYGRKRILHPHVNFSEQQTLVRKLVDDIDVLPGFFCENWEDAQKAFALLGGHVVIKPDHGALGEGIITDVTEENKLAEYDFANFGSAVVEKYVDFSHAIAVHFKRQGIYGEVLDQVISSGGTAYEGSVGPSEASSIMQNEARSITQKLILKMKPMGPGGFDYFVVDEKLYLTDPNVGRFTGAHAPKLFRDRWAPNAALRSWQIKPEKKLNRIWSQLQQRGIAFSPEKGCGVFPLAYLDGMHGLFIAVAEHSNEVNCLYDQFMDLLG